MDERSSKNYWARFKRIFREKVCKYVVGPVDDFQANIELSFVNGHYDFISSSTTLSVCVSNLDTSEVDTKPNFQANLSITEKDQNSAYIEMWSRQWQLLSWKYNTDINCWKP